MLAHLNPATDQRIPASRVPLMQERMSCSFEEHHCLSFSEPLIAPLRRDGLGEDIFNAWLPRDLEFTRRTVRKAYTLHSIVTYFRVAPRMVWKYLILVRARTRGTRRTIPTTGPLTLSGPVSGCPMHQTASGTAKKFRILQCRKTQKKLMNMKTSSRIY